MKIYQFRIDDKMLAEVKKEVKQMGFDSVSAFIRQLIREYFSNKNK